MPCNTCVLTVLGGDASMEKIKESCRTAKKRKIDESTGTPTFGSDDIRRGRSDFDSLGCLRTKPGRADSEPSICMSCR